MENAVDSSSWTILYTLDVVAIALFAVSYYRNCYRQGYRIDFWHSQLFLAFVLPNMLMLPFAKSELNLIVVGKDIKAVIAAVPVVFLISLLGYCAVLAGGGLWRLQLGLGLRKSATQLLEVVPRCSMMLMSSPGVLVFQAVLAFLLQWMILALYFFQSGFAFDLRGYTFENPALRPVALVISNYSIIIASHCLARYADRKERNLLVWTLLLTAGLLFFGSRGNLIAIYINVLLCYFVKLRNRISLFRIITLIVVITALGLYLGNVRAGEYSLGSFLASFAVLFFFGNNFSDLRDFAWVYAAWDHVSWAGKTYLAAFLSFVPRFASAFRDRWGMGVATDTTVGLDPQVHPGLRPGMFGEGFFNFGLLGVVVVGIAIGIVLRRVDTDVKNALMPPRPSMVGAFASTMLLGVAGCFAISAGFSGLYVLAGTYLFSWFCIRVERTMRPRQVLDQSGSLTR